MASAKTDDFTKQADICKKKPFYGRDYVYQVSQLLHVWFRRKIRGKFFPQVEYPPPTPQVEQG